MSRYLSKLIVVGLVFVGGFYAGRLQSGPVQASPGSGTPVRGIGSAAYINSPSSSQEPRKTRLLTVERAGYANGAWNPPVPGKELPLSDNQWLIEVDGNRYILSPK